MDRYMNIKNKLLSMAEQDENIKAVVLLGSSTRDSVKADEYSDLDVVIATESTDNWLYGEEPGKLGDVKISFVEPTLGGGKERRVLYDGSLDVDLIIFTPSQFEKAIKDGVAGWIMNRGYMVMYDSEDYSVLLKENVSHKIQYVDLSESEFDNMVNDFFFHTVWAAKKILRGELWTAKMCSILFQNIMWMCGIMEDFWRDGRKRKF